VQLFGIVLQQVRSAVKALTARSAACKNKLLQATLLWAGDEAQRFTVGTHLSACQLTD
jgi:hypothetical protein